MKIILFISWIVLLSACASNTHPSLTEKRSQTDTILSFQGIKLSKPLDSELYHKIKKNCPIKLYDENRDSYIFTEFVINGEFYSVFPGDIIHSVDFKDGTDFAYLLDHYDDIDDLDNYLEIDPVTSGDTVHSICLQGYLGKELDFFGLISLYEESYGSFSYYKRLSQKNETLCTMKIGEMRDPNGAPYKKIDAISDLYKSFGDKYMFVWEWRNQSLVLSYNPSESSLNTTISYLDTGYATRQAEIDKKQKQKEDEEQQIDKLREHQQI